MRVLPDTHSFLWFISGDPKLSDKGKRIVSDMGNRVFLSTAALWEIAIKTSLGKLTLLRPFEDIIPAQLRENEIHILPIRLTDLAALIHPHFFFDASNLPALREQYQHGRCKYSVKPSFA